MDRNNFKLNNGYLIISTKHQIYKRNLYVLLLAIKFKIINKEFILESSVSLVQLLKKRFRKDLIAIVN